VRAYTAPPREGRCAALTKLAFLGHAAHDPRVIPSIAPALFFLAPPGSLDRFHDALDPGETARIAVFGDSHVASDGPTSALRRRLQTRFGDGGHGFVLLGRTWPLYRHVGVRLGAHPAWATRRLRERDRIPVRYGLGGARSTARIRGAVAWAEGEASRIEIVWERVPGGGKARVRIDGRPAGEIDAGGPFPRTDSRVFDVPAGRHRIDVQADGDGPVTLHGAVLERGPGVVVDSLGVPALVSTSLERTDRAALEEHLRLRAPDLVVFAFGTNDVRFDGFDRRGWRPRIAAILRLLRDPARSACLVVGPIDRVHRRSDGRWVASLDEVIALQKGAAADAGCAFFDARAAMGGAGSMARWMQERPGLTLRDGVHLSSRGYDEIAALLEKAIAP